MTGPIGYEDGQQIGARPYLERVGGDMVGPVTFSVSGVTTPHIAAGTGFGPLVLGTAGAATWATGDGDVYIGGKLEAEGGAWLSSLVNAVTVYRDLMVSGGTSHSNVTVNPGTGRTGGVALQEAGNMAAMFYVNYNFDELVIGVGPRTGMQCLLANVDLDHGQKDSGIPPQSNPLFAVFSADDPTVNADRYLAMQHDGTRARLFSKTGNLSLYSASKTVYVTHPDYADSWTALTNVAPALLFTSERDPASFPNDFGFIDFDGAVGPLLSIETASGYIRLAPAAGNDVFLAPSGAGRVKFGTHAAIGAETVTGYIEIKDAGGTPRKIAVVS